jgi:hypothetical protein
MNTALALDLPPAAVRLSRAAAWVCWLAGAAWPLLALAGLAGLSPAGLLERAGLAAPEPQVWGGSAYADWQRLAVVAVLVLPAGMAGWALACLARGFRALAAGQARMLQACAALRSFAAWSVAATAASVVAGMAASVLLTWNHAPGHKQLGLGFSSAQLQTLLMAALVWVFAHLLLRARAVAEENGQFV